MKITGIGVSGGRSFRRSLRSESSMVVSNIPCFCPFCFHIWIFLKAFSFLLSIFWGNITREIAQRYITNVKNQNNRPSYTSPCCNGVKKWYRNWLEWKKRNMSERFHPCRKCCCGNSFVPYGFSLVWGQNLMVNTQPDTA